MKKINIILAFVLGFAAMAFTSCQSDEDNNPVFQKPTAFVLNTPKYASGLYDLKNTETLQLTCSQPDYGYAAAAVYTVEVSTQSDFAPETVQVLPTTFTTCKMDVDANELAITPYAEQSAMASSLASTSILQVVKVVGRTCTVSGAKSL